MPSAPVLTSSTRFDPEWGSAMKRHEGYWGEKAKIGNVECVYIADTTARTLALLLGRRRHDRGRARAGLGRLDAAARPHPARST